MKPDGRALRFDAVEEVSVDEVAFSWRANAHVAPLVSMHVVDQFHAATGSLSGRLFGIPVVRARGPEVDEAEAMRRELAHGQASLRAETAAGATRPSASAP